MTTPAPSADQRAAPSSTSTTPASPSVLAPASASPAAMSPATEARSALTPLLPAEGTPSSAPGQPVAAPAGAPVDVIVVDDNGATEHLRAKKAARVLCAASLNGKRVGPSGDAEARPPKRKAVSSQSSTAHAVDAPAAALSAAGGSSSSTPSGTTSAPPVVAPACALPAPGVGTPTLLVPPTLSGADPGAESAAHQMGGPRDDNSSDQALPTPRPSESTPSRPLPRQAASAFNLDEFARSYEPADFAGEPSSCTERLSLANKVDQLFELLTDLRRELQALPVPAQRSEPAEVVCGFPVSAAVITGGVTASASAVSWTLPPAGCTTDLPPPAVSELRCASFQLPRTRSGRWMSPMSFVLHLRELDCARFDAPPAGSTNANFSADFGAGATLPATNARCPTYEDLLAAIGGLISFGDAIWYDHARHLLSRFIGRALAHLLVDSPHWWRSFCDAAALNGLALRMATTAAPAPSGPSVAPPRQLSGQHRRGPAARTPIMPEHIRRLIPRDRDGREPCPRFLAGGMCYGGCPDRCAHQQRTHCWDGRLPRELQDFIDRHYGDTLTESPTETAACTYVHGFAKALYGPCAPQEPPHGVLDAREDPGGGVSPPALPHRDRSRYRKLYGQPPTSSLPLTAGQATSTRADAPGHPHVVRSPGDPSTTTAAAPARTCGCRARDHSFRRHHAPREAALRRLIADSAARAKLWDAVRLRNINAALGRVGLKLPTATPATRYGSPSLNKALQRVLSEFVRRTRISLPQFIELMRGQTSDDYRPNKAILPDVFRAACADYPHLDALMSIAEQGNIRKEQDLWRCYVLDLDILQIWSEIHISPFGVVDKGDADPRTTGRVIHDLSFPEGSSVNDVTDTSGLCTPQFKPCEAIAVEILDQQEQHPDAEIQLQAGDVASAFRNVCTHSRRVQMFGGRLEPDNALVIDASAAFGWSGWPASYGVVAGAIAHIHGNAFNRFRDSGPFNYYWVDDHINVAAAIGTNCMEVERSLRSSMVIVLGHDAVSEDKFTLWSPRQQVLGLVFDSAAGTVAMPADKILNAQACVRTVLFVDSLSRSDYRNLLGRLRHVATCARSAQTFLQRLCLHERHLRRWHKVPVSAAMKDDLLWWLHILESPALNGVPLSHFRAYPVPAMVVKMDASDSGLCVLVRAARTVLRYSFSAHERSLIEATKSNPSIAFDINYRELLSCAFAVHAWEQNGFAQSTRTSPSTLARVWELEYGLRFSAAHVAGVDNRIADAGSRYDSSSTLAALFDDLTRDWQQVTPLADVSSLEAIWPIISARTRSRQQHSASIAAHSEHGTRGRPNVGSNPLYSGTPGPPSSNKLPISSFMASNSATAPGAPFAALLYRRHFMAFGISFKQRHSISHAAIPKSAWS
ncbi:hypothetical protein PHYSODRAFT_329971 [Phytophthora sojae]|uniref:Uncharacterized protein n=1 Tax=Phytophthora sojae (strain P6497) TaxID=1094619 RepID=G4ZC13_PHYSP|nr:hypothetical protein PHYSODRAFT_329971 [Phytophthora sojae]EGZ22114.1 hypothetical protein PHYSODRAFT_329971 [Phytophthora sojae]|eukprot:XP_009524831.1 hypothetical protein PHYSODRAFT_329971 [Phytophthora sojae]